MEEARQLEAQGVTALNLIAEDTNQWGSDWGEADPRRLSDLLYALDGDSRPFFLLLGGCVS